MHDSHTAVTSAETLIMAATKNYWHNQQHTVGPLWSRARPCVNSLGLSNSVFRSFSTGRLYHRGCVTCGWSTRTRDAGRVLRVLHDRLERASEKGTRPTHSISSRRFLNRERSPTRPLPPRSHPPQGVKIARRSTPSRLARIGSFETHDGFGRIALEGL
jgi:hypothetical protein